MEEQLKEQQVATASLLADKEVQSLASAGPFQPSLYFNLLPSRPFDRTPRPTDNASNLQGGPRTVHGKHQALIES